jgi:hypothetical protein
MENLRYTLFDLFSYTIPGGLLILSLILVPSFPEQGSTLNDIRELIGDAGVLMTVLFIVVGYCAGFVLCIIGNYLLSVKEFFFPIPKPRNINAGNSQKFVVVREKSKENFKYIEQWNVLKNFSSSLSLALICIDIQCLSAIKAFTVLHFIIGLATSFLVLFKASTYHRWAVIDLDNAFTNCMKPSENEQSNK